MIVQLKDKEQRQRSAELAEANTADFRKLKGWKFDWTSLIKTAKSRIFKAYTEEIEGLMMIQFVEDNFFEMKNIEVSPSNFGAKGRYTNVAQILIAYGCLLSFELNKGPYQGYLSFISKGELIDDYIEKYNAELVYRDRMYINPKNGISLIKENLNLEL